MMSLSLIGTNTMLIAAGPSSSLPWKSNSVASKAADLEFVFLLGGFVELDVVALEHLKGVVDFGVHAFFAAHGDDRKVNRVIRALAGDAAVNFLRLPGIRHVDGSDGEIVDRAV